MAVIWGNVLFTGIAVWILWKEISKRSLKKEEKLDHVIGRDNRHL